MERQRQFWRLLLAAVVMAWLPLPVIADEGARGSAMAEGKVERAMGCLPSPQAGDIPVEAFTLGAAPLPASVDLRAGLPPVADQGQQNSCVAWAVAYYYKSYQEGREQWWALDAPEHQFSPAYVYNQRPTARCGSDQGMTIVAALRILQEGAAPLAQSPYQQHDTCTRPSGDVVAQASEYRARSYAMLFQGKGRANIEQIKAHLAAGDPVVMAIPVYANFRNAAPGRAIIDVPPTGSSLLGGHAVLAVGYDADGILIVNSWGRSWGEEGFAHLTYDFVRRYAWEAWTMADLDATPPSAPATCNLAPAGKGSLQDAEDPLTFTWADANDHGGSGVGFYRVYWGADPEGQSPALETEVPRYVCTPPPLGETYYLRVQAVDRAGNASAWNTLFVQGPPVSRITGAAERIPAGESEPAPRAPEDDSALQVRRAPRERPAAQPEPEA